MVIEPRFDKECDFYGGLAQVITRGAIGYMDKTGEIVIQPNTQWAVATRFSEGLASVTVGRPAEEYEGYIDTSGSLVIKLAAGISGYDFSEGVAPAKDYRHHLWGYIDRGGRLVISPQFYRAGRFSGGGRAVVQLGSAQFAIIDTSGCVLTRLSEFEGVGDLSEGLAPAYRADTAETARTTGSGDAPPPPAGVGFIDQTGMLVVSVRFAAAADFRGGLAYIEDGSGKMGYVDHDGAYVWREKQGSYRRGALLAAARIDRD